jgi:tight adherence protein B
VFVVVAFLIFFGALAGALYYTVSVPRQQESDAMAMRLRELRARAGTRQRGAGDLFRREERGTFAFLGDFVAWVGVLRRLQEIIDQANLKYRAVDVFAVTVLITVIAWIFFGVVGLSLWTIRLTFSLLLGSVPVAIIARIRKRRLAKFDEQFPDAIDLFNRSMKAGHTIHSGLESIANESLDPVRMEFKKVIEELALGSQIDDALHNLGRRIPSIDLKFFITGLILQRQTGANLIDVLENLGLLIRERLNMTAKMKAHTAQQRLSAGLLCALPIVMAVAFWFLKPEYIVFLYTDDIGSMFLTYAIVSEIIGILIIRKVANIKF